MDDAAKRLQEIKTDEETEQAAKAAAERFKQLLDSLKADRAGNGGRVAAAAVAVAAVGAAAAATTTASRRPPSSSCSRRSSRRSTTGPRPSTSCVAATRTLTPEQTAELKRLAEDQGALADLVRDMTRPRRDDGEE